MTDKELLELAAKAAGIFLTRETLAQFFPEWDWDDDFEIRHEKGGISGAVVVRNFDGELSGTTRETWNPLTDDGDALRLAVRLQIDLVHFTGHLRADVAGMPDVHQMHECDPYAATRRAIVRAAAEIGRAMK